MPLLLSKTGPLTASLQQITFEFLNRIWLLIFSWCEEWSEVPLFKSRLPSNLTFQGPPKT